MSGTIVYNPFTDNLDYRGASGGGGGGVSTINSISPDGGGNFTLESSDGTVTLTPTANGIDLSTMPNRVVLSVAMRNDLSLPPNSLQTIIYDEVISDTEGGYVAGDYTVSSGGLYEICVSGGFLSTAGFTAGDGFITVNPANYQTHTPSTPVVSDANTTVLNAGIVIPLNAGDVVSIKFFAITVGDTNYTVSGYANGFYNNFRMIKIN